MTPRKLAIIERARLTPARIVEIERTRSNSPFKGVYRGCLSAPLSYGRRGVRGAAERVKRHLTVPVAILASLILILDTD
jgi:hypothetical protein